MTTVVLPVIQTAARVVDARRFIEWRHPDQTGLVCFAVGHRPHRTSAGKYAHRPLIDGPSVAYPGDGDQLDDVLAQLFAVSATADVYVCPNLMCKTRKAASAVGPMVIACDWDGHPDDTGATLETVAALNGYAVRSGTDGHLQVYVPLAAPVTPARYRTLCKALHDKLPPGARRRSHAGTDPLGS